ncbi:MAG TPA: hypothetical protein VF677_12790 [Flavobacterium sp.]|jgi:heme/copper-type cytochrome/quinol oxidase subunit 2
MLGNKIIGFCRFISKVVLLVVTLFLAVFYVIALSAKIGRPNFKNLPVSELIVFGVIILILIFINLIVFGVFKSQRKSSKF